jgi:hypothetical protein
MTWSPKPVIYFDLPMSGKDRSTHIIQYPLCALVQAYGPISPTTAIRPTHPIANAHALGAQLSRS